MKKLYIIFSFLPLAFSALSGQHWAEVNGWSFDNFGEGGDLSWERFRETYVGVAPEEFASVANFDYLFYHAIYKDKLATDGHCFGMSLMAVKMLKYGGELGYCHAPSVFPGGPEGPTEPELKRAIQILHGYQLNYRFLRFLMDVIAINKNRDGNYAYSQMEYYLMKDDPVVISITKSLSPSDGGHSMVAYDIRDMPGPTKRIYVYDPNRSYFIDGELHNEYYTLDSNWIEVEQVTGAWTFKMAGENNIYSGDPSTLSGGNIIVTPLSVAGPRDRLPQSLFADVAAIKNSIIIMQGDAELVQIRTSDGKKYLDTNTGSPYTDPTIGIRTVLPIIPMNGGKPVPADAPKMYMVQSRADVSLDFQSKGGAYSVAAMGSRGYVEVKGQGLNGLEQYRFKDLDLSSPKVEIEQLSQPGKLDIRFLAIKQANQPLKQSEMKDVKLPYLTPMRIGMNGDIQDMQATKLEVAGKQ